MLGSSKFRLFKTTVPTSRQTQSVIPLSIIQVLAQVLILEFDYIVLPQVLILKLD